MIPTFALICMSAVVPYTLTLGDHTEHGTKVYRTPPHCSAGILPEVQGPPVPQAKPPAAKTEAPARVTKAKAKPCKKGRTRNSRGVCGRWKR